MARAVRGQAPPAEAQPVPSSGTGSGSRPGSVQSWKPGHVTPASSFAVERDAYGSARSQSLGGSGGRATSSSAAPSQFSGRVASQTPSSSKTSKRGSASSAAPSEFGGRVASQTPSSGSKSIKSGRAASTDLTRVPTPLPPSGSGVVEPTLVPVAPAKSGRATGRTRSRAPAASSTEPPGVRAGKEQVVILEVPGTATPAKPRKGRGQRTPSIPMGPKVDDKPATHAQVIADAVASASSLKGSLRSRGGVGRSGRAGTTR